MVELFRRFDRHLNCADSQQARCIRDQEGCMKKCQTEEVFHEMRADLVSSVYRVELIFCLDAYRFDSIIKPSSHTPTQHILIQF
jgi:hypothetical protein